jgi:outer membrane protein assembly factor BamB
MNKFKSVFFISFIIIYVSLSCDAQNIYQWRGLDRTGEYPSISLLKEWPKKGPELLLSIDDLSESYSSVVFKDEIIYTTGRLDDTEYLTAIDLKGNIKWSVPYGESFSGSFKNARSTPTIEDDFAYVISGSGDLAAINIKTGIVDWMLDAYATFKGKAGQWGTAESPLIVDEKMIYTPGGKHTTIVAVDKRTGETIWKSESLEDNSAYCSPTLMEYKQIKTIVTVTANYVIGLNPDNGEIRWKFDYGAIDIPKMGGEINPVTPLVRENEIFVSSGYNHVGLMLVVAENQQSVKVKWKTSDLDNHHGGVVEYNGYLYGSNFKNVASGDWICLDWQSGKLQYAADFHGKGSIIISGAYLICYDERGGNIALVKANPKKFDIISTFKINSGRGPHWSHPTIYNDMLFIRHGRSLEVYNIGA